MLKKDTQTAPTPRNWPIKALKEPERRARIHSPKQIAKIEASIQEFGFLGSLLIEEDGTIIAGMARREAALRLGLETLPVLIVSDLRPAQVKAYRLAHNKLAELASWDEEALSLEFKNILELDSTFELEVAGFETAEIDLLLDPTGPSRDSADEQIPAVQELAVSQPGDLWQLGPHLLLCGDAKDPQSYQTVLGGAEAAMVIIDPPWNVPINGHVGNMGQTQHREFVEASGELSDQDFQTFLQGRGPSGIQHQRWWVALRVH